MKSALFGLISHFLSALARIALRRRMTKSATRSGLPVLANTAESSPITLDLVNQLRDDMP
jgi:hypothetical protein